MKYNISRQKVKVNLTHTPKVEHHDKNKEDNNIHQNAKPRPTQQAEPNSSIKSQRHHNFNNIKKNKNTKKTNKNKYKNNKKR